MCSNIEKEMGVLRGGVLGPVRSGERHHQQHRLAGEPALGRAQERDRVVGYQVGVVILENK